MVWVGSCGAPDLPRLGVVVSWRRVFVESRHEPEESTGLFCLDTLLQSLCAFALASVVASLFGLRRAVTDLRLRIVPVGWKGLMQGPPEGTAFPAVVVERMGPLPSGPSIVLVLGNHCSACNTLESSVERFVWEHPGIPLILLSASPLANLNGTATRSVVDAEAMSALGIQVIPFGFFLRDGVVVRKGIVNSYEQWCLFADPDRVGDAWKLRL